MKIKNNLFNPLPIFGSKDEWYSNKETYKGKSSPTIAPCNYILPIQLTIDREMYEALTSIDSNIKILFSLISHDDKKTYNLNKNEVLRSIDLLPTDMQSDDMYASVYMGGRWIVSHDIPIGTYYLMMSYGNMNDIADSKEWYSDLFTMVYNTDRLLHLEYRNSTAIEGTDVYMPFESNKETKYMDIYLDTTLMMPEFHFESEETMTDGYKRISKRVSYKTLQAKFFCTEYMAEALRMLWHSDRITARYRGHKYAVNDMDMQVSWDFDNHFCTVDMKLTIDTVLQTNANGTTYTVAQGDFNNDYNEDYKKN